jgi:RimJ/RimL family protein N-acetyltransferase
VTPAQTLAPTLATPRLTLRPMRPGDWPAYAAFMAGARSVHMGGPLDAQAAWGSFCHDAAGWALWGAGALMVEAAGETVGQVGVSHGPRFPEAELGWLLYDGAGGRGYAAEAAGALRDWAFAAGMPTLVSYIDPANAASIRLAERLGAVRDPDAVPQDAGDLVYRHRPTAGA